MRSHSDWLVVDLLSFIVHKVILLIVMVNIDCHLDRIEKYVGEKHSARHVEGVSRMG